MAVARQWAMPAPEVRPRPLLARAERRWVAVVTGCLLFLTIVPIAVAAARTPAGRVFSGYVVIAVDGPVYEADWRLGASGSWLFSPGYTSEPLPGTLLFPWYVWTGQLVGRLAGPWLYHLSRLGAAAALLIATYVLAAECLRARRLRRRAFILAALGGGIGPFLGMEVHLGPFALRPTEMRVAGTGVSDLISMAPHLPWAAALLCWVFIAAMRLARDGRRRSLVSGLAAWLGLELIYPQLALLALAVILSWAAVSRRRSAAVYAGLASIVLAPYLVYIAVVRLRLPLGLEAVRLSFDLGDPFGFVVLSHLAATVLIGIALAFRRLPKSLWLPALWIVWMTAFMFLPGVNRILGRSFIASSIPFGLVAVAGLNPVLRAIRAAAWRRRALLAILTVASLFGVYNLAQPYWIAAQRLDANAEYEHAGEAHLLAWLDPRTTRQDVVLTAYLDGLFVPAQTHARAFAGHPDQTIDVAAKADQASAFFDTWSADERDQFLARTAITYVLATGQDRVERLLADPHLRLLREDSGAALFQVMP